VLVRVMSGQQTAVARGGNARSFVVVSQIVPHLLDQFISALEAGNLLTLVKSSACSLLRSASMKAPVAGISKLRSV
jgi:hypothetical protein